MTRLDAPFSARHHGQHRQIDVFPDSVRTALLHLLYDLEEKRYVSSWAVIARELRRIDRQPPAIYNPRSVSSNERARADAEVIIASLKWDKAYDFCERLYSHLSQDLERWTDNGCFDIPKSDVQKYIASELEQIFLEEGLACEFFEGRVRRRGRKHTVDQTTRAQVVLGDDRLTSARKHYAKSLRFFRQLNNPDYENCVKEAVCAVEAAGKALFPAAKAATLGELVKWLLKTKDYKVPPALAKTIEYLYAYRNGGDGVSHGGATGGTATVEVAEYVLSVSASQIIYLVDIEAKGHKVIALDRKEL